MDSLGLRLVTWFFVWPLALIVAVVFTIGVAALALLVGLIANLYHFLRTLNPRWLLMKPLDYWQYTGRY